MGRPSRYYSERMVMTVKIKFCGFTRLSDALVACELGADALGFNFFPKSPRFLELKKAAGIIREMPPFVSTVGLFVDPQVHEIQRAVMTCRLDYLQFHGEVPDSLLDMFPKDKIILAQGIKDARSLKQLQGRKAAAYMLDAYVPGQHGGTGKTFRWDLAVKAQALGKPIILAGGLTPDNVASAIQKTQPWAVDAASGVERSPGIKDTKKMAAFVAAVRA
jgi:phosphoribosylanthranilate isomerase